MAAIRCKTCQMFAPVNESTPPGVQERFIFFPESQALKQVLEHTAEVRIVNICDNCKNEISEHVFTIVTDLSLVTDHKCPTLEYGIGWSCRFTNCERSIEMYPPGKKVQVKMHVISYAGLLRCGCGEVKLTFSGKRAVKTSEMTRVL